MAEPGNPQHIVSGPDEFRARIWSRSPATAVFGRVDGEDWFPLEQSMPSDWWYPLPGVRFPKGEHQLDVEATNDQGLSTRDAITFLVDPTRRYTPVPRAWPIVKATAFC
jgi:hypothetical protein